MIPESVTSMYWFIFSCVLPIFGFMVMNKIPTDNSVYCNALIALCLACFMITLIIFTIFKDFRRKVAICSSFLGSAFALGLLIAILLPHKWAIFGWYLCFLTFFHFSEFLTIAIANPASLSIDSFMLNHSYTYAAALSVSWVEYFIEIYFFPELKDMFTISAIGVVFCVFGETLRKTAMITANTNFHHIVQTVKRDNHHLITHGVYRICRHPGYVGWYYWAVGTQLILINPFCFVLYALCIWKFFHDRIFVEEVTLINFFGSEYLNYKKRVISGLPFIWGYKEVTRWYFKSLPGWAKIYALATLGFLQISVSNSIFSSTKAWFYCQ